MEKCVVTVIRIEVGEKLCFVGVHATLDFVERVFGRIFKIEI